MKSPPKAPPSRAFSFLDVFERDFRLLGGRSIARHAGGEKSLHVAACAKEFPAGLSLERHLVCLQHNYRGVVVKILAHFGKAILGGLAFDRADVEVAVGDLQRGSPTIIGGGLQFG